MPNKIKTNQLSIIKLNNKTYIPYQLHQLPKWFDKYTTNYFNLKGYTYISLDEHYNNNKYFDYNNFKTKLTYNRDLDYKQRR